MDNTHCVYTIMLYTCYQNRQATVGTASTAHSTRERGTGSFSEFCTTIVEHIKAYVTCQHAMYYTVKGTQQGKARKAGKARRGTAAQQCSALKESEGKQPSYWYNVCLNRGR